MAYAISGDRVPHEVILPDHEGKLAITLSYLFENSVLSIFDNDCLRNIICLCFGIFILPVQLQLSSEISVKSSLLRHSLIS